MNQNDLAVHAALRFRTVLPQWGCAIFLVMSAQVIHAEEASERHVISPAAMECMNRDGYPKEAIRAEATGVTVIRVHVDEEGVVTDADVVNSSGSTRAHKILDRATIAKFKCPGLFKKTGAPYDHEVKYVWRLQ